MGVICPYCKAGDVPHYKPDVYTPLGVLIPYHFVYSKEPIDVGGGWVLFHLEEMCEEKPFVGVTIYPEYEDG